MLLLFTFIIWLPQILSWEPHHLWCEGTSWIISCEDDSRVLHIVPNTAFWGRRSSTVCTSKEDHHSNCSSSADIYGILKKKCEGKKQCDIVVDVKTFGDPCPTVHKYLEFEYFCPSNPQLTTTKKPPTCPTRTTPPIITTTRKPTCPPRTTPTTTTTTTRKPTCPPRTTPPPTTTTRKPPVSWHNCYGSTFINVFPCLKSMCFEQESGPENF